MFISWHGLGCFKIQSKEVTILTDPYQDNVGWKLPKVKAEIVTVSDPESNLCNNVQRVIGEPVVIDNPGEYESKKTFIYCLPHSPEQQHPSISLIEVEDIFIAHLGLANSTFSTEQLEILEGADILFLPVQSLSGEKLLKVISQIEPRIIIPMYYQLPGLKVKSAPIEAFAKAMGVKDGEKEAQEKLKISKKDLPEEETKVMFLKKV